MKGSVPKFRLLLLARFELTGPDGPVDLPNRKLAGLLAYLACTAPVPQSREKLAALLWGSYFETQAHQNLRQALFRLRRVLGADALVSDGDEVRLAAGVVDCDVAQLRELIAEGTRASLAAAAELYQGPLLGDVNVVEEAWTDWLGTERLRIEGLALDAMIRHAEQELALGNAEFAHKAANRAIAVNPLREDAHRLAMQALAAAGRKPEAIRHYQDLVVRLKRELNTEPDAATRSLVAELDSVQPVSKPAGIVVETPASEIATRPERRQLTVMVCNIVAPVQLAATLDPEDMHDLVATFHNAIGRAAATFDGFVAQYLGDGAHVYFGYPTAREHDAERAVRAACAIVNAIGQLKAPSGATLQASIGVASGLVVVSEWPAAGNTSQRAAIGEAPNVAAHLQVAASPGEILIAASTQRLVGGLFDCRAVDPGKIKGLPAGAWLVRGEKAGVGRFDALRSRALSPLAGRQEEIDLLMRRWQQAKRGEGRVVLLSGEAGIGKSRIARSLLDSIAGEPHARLRYFCSPHHAHTPLYPFIVQLERSFEPHASAAGKRDRLETLFRPAQRNPQQELALIAELLSIPDEGRYPQLTATPQQKREMTLAALIRQLEGIAAKGPVLVLVEDVHWIDPTSLDLLNRVIARAGGMSVLLIVTCRPEFKPAWAGEPHVSMLSLSRLGRRDGASIIDGVAKDNHVPDVVREQVLARADGVPLFIEELTRSLLESGPLPSDGPLPTPAVPETLQASLVSRLDRLGAAKDVALIAAAIGREFSHELIAAVASMPGADLDDALAQLAASGLVSSRGTPPEAMYAFRHTLVQDAAYATMLKSHRRQLHAAIAQVLVDRFPATVERQPEVAARHFTEAGLATDAIGYWRKAGQLANARSAAREAATSYEQALQLLDTLPESTFTLQQGCDIRLKLRSVLLELGRSREILECLQAAEQLAQRLNDDNRLGRVYAHMTATFSMQGDLDKALATGVRTLDAAIRLGDPTTRSIAASQLVHVHHARGEYERVVELASSNIATLPADLVFSSVGLGGPPAIWDRGWLVMSLSALGRFSEATAPAAEVIRIAESTKHAFSIGWAVFAAGSLPVRRGDWTEARALYDRVIAVSKAADSPFLIPMAVAPLAMIHALLGNESEALDRLRQCERVIERQAASGGSVGVFGPLFAWIGRAALALGRLDDAQRLGARAIEFCERHPGYGADALHLLGEIASHPERFDAETAEARYRAALARATSGNMRPLIAHCHFGLGKLPERRGRPDQTCAHLATATAMYREMAMPFFLQQAEAAMHRAPVADAAGS
jgi:class 3 adenylate cyclase